jgi:hypothetical protein
MRTLKGNKATLTALFLLLTFAATLVAFPVTNAHDPPWTVPTWSYIICGNDPIGIGQQQYLNFWLNTPPPTAYGPWGDRWTFTVEITKPDGNKETLGPIMSDPTGSNYAMYTCSQLGQFSAVLKFPGKTIDGTPNGVSPDGYGAGDVGDVYQASTSDAVNWTVQQEPIQPWQEPPLPTSFWTRVNVMNRGWASLVGNWLAGAAQNVGPTTNFAYGAGPESAHVLWTKPVWAGGIMDARFGDTGYQTAHYDGLWFYPPIILNGKLYYNALATPREGWYCVDLYTGETEYFHNTTGPVQEIGGSYYDFAGAIEGEQLSFGQIFNYKSPNQEGGFPYLWSTKGNEDGAWMLFDQVTGNYICKIINVPSWTAGGFGPSGVNVYGKDGSILYYYIVGTPDPVDPFAPTTAPFYLQCWNTSQAIWYKPFFSGPNIWMWRTYLNYTFDGNNGYSLNVSVPEMPGSIRAVREDQFVIGGTSGKHNDTYTENGVLWALSLKPGQEGTLLWNITYTPPLTPVADTVTVGGTPVTMNGPIVDPEDSVFLFNLPVTRQWWAFDLNTGKPLWGPSAQESPWNLYGMFYQIYNGILYSYGSGQTGANLVAYDIKTGLVKWTYVPSNVGFESPFGTTYPLYCCAIADGKLYMYTTKHHTQQPMFRGSYVRCINTSNGAELWKLSLWNGIGIESNNAFGAVSNGYFVCLNLYDNQLYCIGKSPSATTVYIQNDVVPLGNNIMVKGTVTDQGPGQTCLGIPAKGTAAISDADQQAWMEYLYEQLARPTNATGVPVKLTAIDPNNNLQDLGTVVSDSDGNFATMWTPPVEGRYQITATFAGSKSYGDSRATTYLQVFVQQTIAVKNYPQPYDYTMHFAGIGIVIILAVAIVGILLLRKK